MKKVTSKLEIGEGLFTDGPVPVEFDFGSCVAVFDLLPLSHSVHEELKEEGTDLTKAKEAKEGEEGEEVDIDTIDMGLKLFKKVVVGWTGLTDPVGVFIPFTDENRDKLAMTGIAGEIINAARELVVARREAEEEN